MKAECNGFGRPFNSPNALMQASWLAPTLLALVVLMPVASAQSRPPSTGGNAEFDKPVRED
jgi:hypothetical protein